jgi:hypothetical protein
MKTIDHFMKSVGFDPNEAQREANCSAPSVAQNDAYILPDIEIVGHSEELSFVGQIELIIKGLSPQLGYLGPLPAHPAVCGDREPDRPVRNIENDNSVPLIRESHGDLRSSQVRGKVWSCPYSMKSCAKNA